MSQEQEILFAVDYPSTDNSVINSPFLVSGWLLAPPSRRLRGLEIYLDDRLRARTETGLRRADVAAAYPHQPGALWSGFAVEVWADDIASARQGEGDNAQVGVEEVGVEVKAVFEDGAVTLRQVKARLQGLARLVEARPKRWNLAELLACPQCLGELRDTATSLHCQTCQRDFEKRRGTPIFADAGSPVHSRLLETTPTNPNAENHTRIITHPAHHLVLDFGAGNPRASEHHANVVFHEFAQYAYTDVVSTCARLPYREAVFDAVLSKAVFEHLARPWEVADELYRVLKPGGLLYVDTAFMQPLHSDPYHFFNMTLDGAKEIFKRFRLLDCGVQPYQTPAYSLRMQIEVMLEHLQDARWRRVFEDLRASLNDDFDRAFDAKGLERMAAGVFFIGRKE